MKNKLIFCLILFVFIPVVSLLTGMLICDLSFATGAEGNLVIKGSEEYGLRLEHSDNPFVFENLYPGYPSSEEEGSSTLAKISNTGNKKFTLLIENKLMPN